MTYHPKWMPRKVYKQADIVPAKPIYIPGMKHGNSAKWTITEEQLTRIKMLMRFGKDIKELAKLFNVSENQIKAYLR